MAKQNVIVIMLDSWQFNYTGCYGNDWIKTPNIDALAREGVLFENCYAESSPTIPCRRAMHTGRYTLHDIGWAPLRPEDTTIADLCWGKGIHSCMLTDAVPNHVSKYGYSRGFDKFEFIHGHEGDGFYENDSLYHLDPEAHWSDPGFVDRIKADPDGEMLMIVCNHDINRFVRQRQYWKTEEDQNPPRLFKKAVNYLDEVNTRHPFYLYIDCWDPHEPWDPPSVYDPNMPCPYDPDYKGADIYVPPMGSANMFTEEQLHHIRMLFAEKTTMVDRWLGHFLDAVRERGLMDNTLIWLTSDHGEPLGHGEHGHGIMRKCRPWPYEELVHVPLIVKFPGCKAGSRVKGFTQSCDCAPTVCDWLGMGGEDTEEMTGKSLIKMCTGEEEKVRDFAIAGYNKHSWSIITEDFSYIHWLNRTDNITVMGSMYGADDPNLAKANKLENIVDMSAEVYGVDATYRDDATLDDEAQWTCTPGSRVELPESDELYDRKNDPFQLKNIIKDNPEKAGELLRTLREFMAELRTL